jgi:hypothetical protein
MHACTAKPPQISPASGASMSLSLRQSRQSPEDPGATATALVSCCQAALQTRCRRASTRLLATLLPGA